MRRLIVRVVFSLLVYNTSVWLVGRTANAAAYLLAKAGTPELWDLFHGHPFAKSMGIGIIAGLIPFQLWLTLSGFIRVEVPEFLRKLELDQMKLWIILFYSPILVMALVEWVVDWFAMHSRTLSVLQDSSSMPIWRMFDTFFATSCRNIFDIRLDLWTDNFAYQCAIHVLMISAFLMATGYSIAPSLRSQLLRRVWVEHPATVEVAQDEAEPTKSVTPNEHNEDSH
jgi:hypothetical protein